MGTPFLTALHNPGNDATNTGSGVAMVHGAQCTRAQRYGGPTLPDVAFASKAGCI